MHEDLVGPSYLNDLQFCQCSFEEKVLMPTDMDIRVTCAVRVRSLQRRDHFSA